MRSVEDIHEDVYGIVKGEIDVAKSKEIVFSTRGMSDKEKEKVIEKLEKKYGVKARR